MRASARIAVREVSFGYRANILVFDRLSMEFDGGSVAAILGPSGVGKSTLLSLIAGTLRPSAGAVEFYREGRSGSRPPTGLVFQAPTLIPWRTVSSNILFGVEIKHRERLASAKERARELLLKFGLNGAEDRYPFELSGGMQQKVSIARALVSGAGILLLDEPFSNSDFISRRILQEEISHVVDAEGTTAILVTHDINDALRLADRVMLVAGRPVELLDTFEIEIPRGERLGDAAAIALKPYFDRVWSCLSGSQGEVFANA